MNGHSARFEAGQATGAPRTVLSRGATVFDTSKIVSQPGHGRFVRRSLSPAELQPALA